MSELKFIKNPNGPTLGTMHAPILKVDGLFFKDLERTGELLPYEDWRLSAEERAEDLAKRMTVEEMAGLMLYSSHQLIPFHDTPNAPFRATYNGVGYEASGARPYDLTDQQKKFLKDDHVRNVLAVTYEDSKTAARWNNEMQSFCETQPHGIPVNTSSDPRHRASEAGAEFKSQATDVSKWPEGLAMAATFDPKLCEQFARVMAKEYRALGIATALSPQVDIGSDPRWMRTEDTFGASPELVTDMSRAYCDGLQTDPESKNGWGKTSVSAMAKHWPGGGPCESGRDAHYPFGKYAVYPGNNLNAHLKPFLEGAFRLDGPTKTAAAVMPYYTISTGVDPSGELVGNNFNHYIITDMLREKAGFDGVVCTDWGITKDPAPTLDAISPCHGMEESDVVSRHVKVLEAGCDQFGGNDDIKPVLAAYQVLCEKYGEEKALARFRRSAKRLLLGSFRCGLFENPYLNPAETSSLVGNEEFCKAGFEAQLKSVVMLKNKGVLPVKGGLKVYIPDRTLAARKAFVRNLLPAEAKPGADKDACEKFFQWVDTPEEADLAICFIDSPITNGGYDHETGYHPISLQYRPYTAATSRAESLASGDPREKDHPNRSYLGKAAVVANESDLDLVIKTKTAMQGKPVIVVVRMKNACILSEVEPYADALLVDFGVQQDAIMTVITGGHEPEGLLPIILPADMETVEQHCEDVSFDFTPYTDSLGHTYDFGFGLNWSGVISDERTRKYHR